MMREYQIYKYKGHTILVFLFGILDYFVETNIRIDYYDKIRKFKKTIPSADEILNWSYIFEAKNYDTHIFASYMDVGDMYKFFTSGVKLNKYEKSLKDYMEKNKYLTPNKIKKLHVISLNEWAYKIFYPNETSTDKIIMHELTHFLFNTNKEFKTKALKLINSWPDDIMIKYNFELYGVYFEHDLVKEELIANCLGASTKKIHKLNNENIKYVQKIRNLFNSYQII